MNQDEVWVVVSPEGDVAAYETQDQALAAAVDMTDPWIECVTIQGKVRQAGVRVSVPTTIGRPATYWNPWSGGAA